MEPERNRTQKDIQKAVRNLTRSTLDKNWPPARATRRKTRYATAAKI